ncbi:MAG: hypothetical protein ACUVRG_06550, partial [Ignavibacterium sp.]|uniref:hypothetical protein n=1 Tax=Ignavibacterium sp. TaxID=2651167 RepID=UPI00404A1C86
MIRTYKLLLLIFLMFLIALPRFNWGDLPQPLNKFVGEKPFDVEQYEKYVKYFRGDKNLADELEGPFSYRPLVPLFASLLPLEPLTSINLVNLFFLTLGLIYLIKLQLKLGFNEKEIIIGCLIFIISFPLFYYSTSGYIDASLIGVMMISNYYLMTNRYSLFTLLFTFGIFIKETIVILLPVSTVYYLMKEKTRIKFVKISVPIILYLIIVGVIRNLAPQKEIYVWKPSYEILHYNLLRIKTYISFILTLGIPGLLSFYIVFTDKRKNIPKEILYPFLIGIAFSILLWIYSLFAAYSDGRQIWT